MSGGARSDATGRVKPISQYVLKVHSRCDLACDHCYIYEHPDQSWRHRPLGIEPAVVQTSATRIAEHAAAHRLPEVSVVLHGGEPLLLGEQRLRVVLAELQSRIGSVTQLDLRLQTNAVRLSPALCALFAEYGVKVGVSLDGDRAANDRHRRFADGRSSHAQVRHGLELLRSPAYRDIFAGILCTVDLANDPIAVVDALVEEEPPRVDFLLPHGNWDHPPPRPEGAETAYADWLMRIFDHWNSLGRPMPIRLFDSIEALALGRMSQSEGIGALQVDLLVIETDGSWEQVDSLKSAYDGAPATGMNVFDHTVDQAAAHPAIASRQEGISVLCGTCRACPVVERCGGGLYAHRYRNGTGFQNPSVYCSDLKLLIEHVGIPEGESPARPIPAAAQQEAVAPDDAPWVSGEDLDSIAAAPVDSVLARRLAAWHVEITRISFDAIWQVGTCHARDNHFAIAARELLLDINARAPDSVETVLAHPFARAWAMRRLEHTSCGPSCGHELAHLASFAMAAAVRAGVPAELVIPLYDGVAYLPTLGAWDLRRPGAATARVAVREDVLEVCDGDIRPGLRIESLSPVTPNPSESALRTEAQIGTDHRVTLDDLDPYRDCHDFQVTGRLNADQVDRWDRTFSAATDALKRWAPQYAGQVAACIRTLVPLVADVSGLERSVTSGHTFGVFGAALPARPETLAMLLVRESQHSVLNPVLDAADLITQDNEQFYKVAWRPDPRRARGVLQSVFASIALAEVWRARGQTSAVEGGAARDQSSTYAADAERALDTLRTGAALTPLGERFAAGLYERLRRLRK